ncbi:MAG: hypothetical protein ABSF53_05705 [Terracidiphilus sp.]|jgi:hypothetical protein
MRHLPLPAALSLAILTFATASAQDSPSPTNEAPTATSPAAFVYVASNFSAINEIVGYAAAANGKLTPLPGSPYPYSEDSLAATGDFLFGAETNPIYIDSFSVASDGALTFLEATATRRGDCLGSISNLILDHTGATLYGLNEDSTGTHCVDDALVSYEIEKPSGKLNYLGNTGFGSTAFEGVFNFQLPFSANDKFAYVPASFDPPATILGFERHSNGKLEFADTRGPMPKKEDDTYLPFLVATDPFNHVAAYVQAFNSKTGNEDGPPQIATYTADASGNLSTTSNFENMPKASIVDSLTDMKMSPTGKFLAVAGVGLQVLHYNGAEPAKDFVTLLPGKYISAMAWDSNDHLYVLALESNMMYVYTVTSTSVSQAPGSPYKIEQPQAISVVIKNP